MDNANLLESIQKELAVRQASKNDLLLFTKYTMNNFMVNWHHRVICDYLNRFSNGDIKNLMIFLPPQTGKSEISTRRFPAFTLGKSPNKRIAICAYNQTFASKFNRDIQRIIQSKHYQNIFSETKLNSKNVSTDNKGSFLKNSFEFEIVDKSGYVKTVGVGSALTGTTVDLGIIDDPIKDRLEANSQTYRDRLWDWYNDVFKTRLHNESQQLITLTRWHEDDLAGRILKEEPEKWIILKLPALNEFGPTNIDPRKIGEALWPAKHSEQRYLDIKNKNPKTFASLYQQRPAPLEGGIIKKNDFIIKRLYEIPKEVLLLNRNFTADTAYTEDTDNDPSGLLNYAIYKDHCYIFNFKKKLAEFTELIDFIEEEIETASDPLKTKVYIEPKASGKSVIQYLKKKTSINAVAYDMPTGDKTQRLWLVEPLIKGGKVVLIYGAWNDNFIDQICTFPNAEHDEEVDCLTMALTQGLLRLDGKKESKPRKMKRIS